MHSYIVKVYLTYNEAPVCRPASCNKSRQRFRKIYLFPLQNRVTYCFPCYQLLSFRCHGLSFVGQEEELVVLILCSHYRWLQGYVVPVEDSKILHQ